jgi:hypothetical protein
MQVRQASSAKVNEVVRKKEERQTMKATTCTQCADFFAQV